MPPVGSLYLAACWRWRLCNCEPRRGQRASAWPSRWARFGDTRPPGGNAADHTHLALDEDRFALFAQRILPLRAEAGGIYAAVLLRLRESDATLVPPAAFLPAAERFHLASRIDRWLLRNVLNWMRRAAWIDCLRTVCA